jgi:hypothetical protein
VLRPQGYSVVSDPESGVVEHDTAQCGHCQRILFTKPGSASTVYLFPQRDGRVLEELGARCAKCDTPVCLTCHAKGVCVPFERWLEQVEARAATRRSIDEALAAG